MSSCFSTPAFQAQRHLAAIGFKLNRGQILEIYAALFGYHHFQQMQADLGLIEQHLENESAWVVLQPLMAFQRLTRLQPEGDHRRALQIIRTELTSEKVFDDDDAFLVDHFVRQAFRDWLLDPDNREIEQAQRKIEHLCDVFEIDDVDFGDLMHARGDFWEGSIGAQLHYRQDDGTVAYKGKFINIGARVRFRKLTRTLLAPYPEVAMGASAILPHDAMGGITL